MTSIRLYGSTFTYGRVEKIYGSYYTETVWYDTGNLKYDDGKYAKTSQIASKAGTQSKPGRLIAKGFTGSFPDNIKINSVQVEWEEYIRNSSGGTVAAPNIPARYVCLYYGSSCYSSTKSITTAVPTSATKRTLKWTSSELPAGFSKSILTSSSFGVYLNPARNANYNCGYMYVDHIQLIVDYTTPTYSVSIQRSGDTKIRDTITYTFTLTNTNNTPHTTPVPCNITFPSDFVIATVSGKGTYSDGVWNASIQSNGVATLTVTGYYTSSGSKQVTFTEKVTNQSTSNTFTVTNPACNITQVDYAVLPVNVNTPVTYEATGLASSSTTVRIPLPNWITLVSYSGEGTYSNGVWTIPDQGGRSDPTKATITLNLKATQEGIYMQQIKDATNTLRSLRCLITQSDLSNPPLYHVKIPSNKLKYLPFGEKDLYLLFPLQVMKKKTDWLYSGHKYEYSIVADGEVIHKFTPNTSSPTLVIAKLPNEPVNYLEVYLHMSNGLSDDFQYYIGDIIISEYPQYSEMGGDWQIVELDDYEAMINPQGGVGPLELIPEEFDIPANSKITGFSVSYDLVTKVLTNEGELLEDADVGVKIRIHADKEVYGEKASVETTGSYEKGWKYDKWGLVESATGKLARTSNTSDTETYFTSGWLDELYVSFTFENPYTSPVSVKLSNVKLKVYYASDEDLGYGVYFNGVPSTSFNALLLNDTEIPFGGKLKLDLTDLKGWSENYIKTVKIEPISFKLKFYIGGDSIEDATKLVREFISLVTPDLNEYGLPEPQSLSFEWDDTTYYYVLSDEIDVKNHVSGYEVTIPVDIPAGHGYGPVLKKPASGTHKSIIPPRPTVYVHVYEDVESLTVSERVTDTVLTVNDSIEAGKTIIIDCENRTVKDLDGEDYTNRLALNSQFFQLHKQYDFTASAGAVVRIVAFREAR